MHIQNPNLHQVDVGNIVKLKDRNKFFKIIDKRSPDNTEMEAKPMFPDEEDRTTIIHITDCELCMNGHEFGQAKRFRKGGTGFKKQGRKLRKPRNDIFEKFFEDGVTAEDLINEYTKNI